jgi:hypothetical protein
MTHKELSGKVAKFVHGVNSDGTWRMPWEHDKDCEWCDGLVDFIEGLMQENKQVWKFRNGSEVRFV